MMTLSAVINRLDKVFPKELIEEGDHCGLLVGDLEQEITHIRVALEATIEVIESAIEDGVNLLIVHHPMIYKKLSSVTSESLEGRKAIDLIKHSIALYVAHSNLDRAEEGLNRFFGAHVGLENISKYEDDAQGYVLIGELEEAITLKEYAMLIGHKLLELTIKYVGDDHKIIKRVAFCTGSGMSLVTEALLSSVDVYLTGDIKYHDSMWVHELGYAVIDITHFASENISVKLFEKLVRKVVDADILISKDSAISNPIKTVRCTDGNDD